MAYVLDFVVFFQMSHNDVENRDAEAKGLALTGSCSNYHVDMRLQEYQASGLYLCRVHKVVGHETLSERVRHFELGPVMQ